MRRMEIGVVSGSLLLPAGIFLASTGLVSDTLGLSEFVYHKYTGYVAAGLGALHLYGHWPQLRGYWQRKLGRGRSAPPQRRSAALQPKQDEAKQESPAPVGGVLHGPVGETPSHMRRRHFLKLLASGSAGFLLGWLIRPPDEPAPLEEQDLGLVYHRWSSPGYAGALSGLLNWGRQPPPYKDYAWAKRLPLPAVTPPSGMSLVEAVTRRRSLRDYAARPFTLSELSWLLHCASGLTASAAGLRAAPSAGALYPIETYVVAHRVEGLSPGLYHYAPAEHVVEQLQSGDLRAEVVQAGLGQEFLAQASAVFVLTAIFQRLRWRYRQRTYRYALLEAGHIGQNIYLAAEAAGMGACAVGAYSDTEINRLIGIDGEHEATLYLLAVGPR